MYLATRPTSTGSGVFAIAVSLILCAALAPSLQRTSAQKPQYSPSGPIVLSVITQSDGSIVTTYKDGSRLTKKKDNSYGRDGSEETLTDAKGGILWKLKRAASGLIRENTFFSSKADGARVIQQTVFSARGIPINRLLRLEDKSGKEISTQTAEVNPETGKLPPLTAGDLNQASANYSIQSKISSGLDTVSFNTPSGSITVNLTDDLAAGDTLTGTVEDQPAGQNQSERAQNQAELQGYVIEIEQQKTPVRDKTFTRTIPQAITVADKVLSLWRNNEKIATSELPIDSKPPAMQRDIKLPTGGQQGRPLTVKCPCAERSPQDYLKVGDKPLTELASSPRKQVYRDTSDAVGTSQIEFRHGSTIRRGEFHNLGIKLSAPKLNLLRGETTTLQVLVSGLEGMKSNTPLELENRSPDVIEMQGGDDQRMSIHPDEIKQGTFRLERVLTGIRAGAFTITGTVRWKQANDIDVWGDGDAPPNGPPPNPPPPNPEPTPKNEQPNPAASPSPSPAPSNPTKLDGGYQSCPICTCQNACKLQTADNGAAYCFWDVQTDPGSAWQGSYCFAINSSASPQCHCEMFDTGGVSDMAAWKYVAGYPNNNVAPKPTFACVAVKSP